VLFNPLAEDPRRPLRLTNVVCERALITWKSLFSFNRDPLGIRLPSAELTFDGKAPALRESEKKRVKDAWLVACGEPKAPTSYPPVEGAKVEMDRLVCVFENVETPFPGFRENATVRVGVRDVKAVSVDRAGQNPENLRSCWLSFNGNFRKATDYILAKRVVAKDLQVTVSKLEKPPPEKDDDEDLFVAEQPSTAKQFFVMKSPEERADVLVSQRVLVAPRAAALFTVGYENLEVTSVRCDLQFEALDLDLPENVLAEQSGTVGTAGLAFRVAFGGIEDVSSSHNKKSDEPEADTGVLRGVSFPGTDRARALRGASSSSSSSSTGANAADSTPTTIAPAVSSIGFVFRSALALFIFLWSGRFVL